ncbi:MAG: SBBP repeat-containing protein [Anaerolineae bacterium]|nr:SBBP repeat-containing protein [Anaerolineae bacterium]
MRNPQPSAGAFTLVIVIVSALIGIGQPTHVQGAAQPNQHSSSAVIQQNYGQLPLSFVPNVGQTNEQARFQVNSLGGTLFFTPQTVVLSLPQRNDTKIGEDIEQNVAMTANERGKTERLETTESEPPLVVRLHLMGANAAAEIVGADPLPGIVNYFIGNDPSQWHANVPTYAGITYRGVYPGIDLHYDGHEGSLKGTYTVAAGIDPSVIRWRYEGNAGLHIDEQTGDLLITLANGNVLREVAPTAWQEKLGSREAVETRYALEGADVRFEIGTYEARLPLVIDPSFVYSTYLGGGSDDVGLDIVADGSGNAYITGYTESTNFPAANALQGSLSGNYDAFVTKLSSTGNALIYSTYLGGSAADYGYSLTVDNTGNAYIAGITASTNFPTSNPFQGTRAGQNDAFIVKLNTAGSALLYSTYLGGSANDYGEGIAVDSNGNAYITGYTGSTNFPTLNPFQAAWAGSNDTFVTKLNAAGNGLVYSTYLGGSDTDIVRDIAVDSSGNIYVTGETWSTNFPTSNPVQGTKASQNDVFVTKMNTTGNALIYSTYLGGSGNDYGYGIAVDSSGNAYITGQTNSTNFPVLNAFQASKAGSTEAFVTKLNATGGSLTYSTYLGGTNQDVGYGIAVDGSGNAYIAGQTYSNNFPIANPLQENFVGPITDAFVTKLNATGGALVYSTYLGGNNADDGRAVAVDGNGNTFVVGYTNSTNFPTSNPYQGTDAGVNDVFVSKISEASTPQPDTIGIFRPTNATFYLRNSNTTGFADSSITFGATTDFPVAGDWDGDGIATVGVYRQTTGQFFLTDSTSNPAVLHYAFVLGSPGDQPIVGDWDGDGKDGAGVFRPSNGLIYLKNDLSTGFADFTMVLGSPGDVGIAGDWNGDGKDSPGVYRPSNQVFYLTNSICNCSVFADAELGLGIAGDTPFVGDWDGDGKAGVGVYRQSNGLTYIKNALTTGFADASFVFGSASDYPLAGYWIRVSPPPALEAAPTFMP